MARIMPGVQQAESREQESRQQENQHGVDAHAEDAREVGSLRPLVFSLSVGHGCRRAVEEPGPVGDAQDAGLDIVSAVEDGSVDALDVALCGPVSGVSWESEESA